MGKLRTTGHWNYEPRTYAMRMSMELRLELAEAALEKQIRAAKNNKLTRAYWKQRLANAMADLKALDPDGWEAWFDSDAVPERGPLKTRALIVDARVRELVRSQGKPEKTLKATLYRNAFIWRAGSKDFFVFDELCTQIYEFASEAQAKKHIDETLEKAK